MTLAYPNMTESYQVMTQGDDFLVNIFPGNVCFGTILKRKKMLPLGANYSL